MDRMIFENINPFVRYAQFLTITSNRQYINISPYDYRLFFCYDGGGEIQVDSVTYEMKPGTLLLWPPGLKYSLLLNKNSKSLHLMQVNFDFTQNNSHLDSPIGPAKWNNFDSSKIIERVEFEDYPKFNAPLFLPDIQLLKNPMYNMVTEFISKNEFYSSRSSGQLKSILSLAGRFAENSHHSSKSEYLVNKVIQYLHTHYHEEVTNKILGEYFGYHPNHLNRLISKRTGMSIHQYLINCRIDAAIDMLQASDLKTDEIARAVGFRDAAHFLKYFKKLTGKNTRDFRQ
ncbi:MAG: AraC family transcriptional regulator [Acutalibacteraceae bacterium]|nr:AraC family transcriptional regulator [Acutalibacteraceae bacterium]